MSFVFNPVIQIDFSHKSHYQGEYTISDEQNKTISLYEGDKYIAEHKGFIKLTYKTFMFVDGCFKIKNNSKHDTGPIVIKTNIYNMIGKTRKSVSKTQIITLPSLKPKTKCCWLRHLKPFLLAEVFPLSRLSVEMECKSQTDYVKVQKVFPFTVYDAPPAKIFLVQLLKDNTVLYEQESTNEINLSYFTMHTQEDKESYFLSVTENGLIRKIFTANLQVYLTKIITQNYSYSSVTSSATLSGPSQVVADEVFSLIGEIQVNASYTDEISFSLHSNGEYPAYTKHLTNVQLGYTFVSDIFISKDIPKSSFLFTKEIKPEEYLTITADYPEETINMTTNQITDTVSFERIIPRNLTLPLTLIQLSELKVKDQDDSSRIVLGRYVLQKVTPDEDYPPFNFTKLLSEGVSYPPARINFRRDGLKSQSNCTFNATVRAGNNIHEINTSVTVVEPHNSCFKNVQTYSRGEWFGNSDSDEVFSKAPNAFIFGTILYNPFNSIKDTNVQPSSILHYPNPLINPTELSLEVSHGIAFSLNVSINPELASARFTNLPGDLAALNDLTLDEVVAIFELKIETNDWGLPLPDETMSILNELVYPLFLSKPYPSQEYLVC